MLPLSMCLALGLNPTATSTLPHPLLRHGLRHANQKNQPRFTYQKDFFLLKQVIFEGPCSSNIKFRIAGTIVAPSDYSSLGNKSGFWIMFRNLNGFSVQGGTFDGKGDSYWRCRKSGSSCPAGARSITFSSCNDVKVRGLTSLNSQSMHIAVEQCKNILFKDVNIKAPSTSPNTDGIDVTLSTGVTVIDATIRTGDDCIALIQGSTNVWIERVTCGPGHGISIGSLGTSEDEAGVQNVTVINSIFDGTQNGVRIKSWAKPSNGYASDIVFRNLTMLNAYNPIIIDQKYCPGDKNCPQQNSGVKISKVSYEHIRGTSACPQAINFDCSKSNPCEGIKLQDIDLVYDNGSSTSTCKNADGITRGEVIPKSCL
ncbi:hypothetical protein JHK87_024395 [Glycine soja]|nr:hypothetical protein JHK87_024395 [Glycine soja]